VRTDKDDGKDVTDEKETDGFLSVKLEMDVLTALGTPRLISPMAKRPNFRTVTHASASIPQVFDQRQERHFQPLLNLNDRLKRHPIIFWGIILVSIALPSAFAIGSLTNPNAAPDAGEPQTVAAIAQNSETKQAQPLPKPSPDSGQLPLWVFGAIALGCTASCLILAGHIKPVEMQTAEVDCEGDFEATPATVQPLETRSQSQINSFKQPLKRLKPYEPTEALPFMQRNSVQVERSQPMQPLAVEWVTSTQPLDPYLSKGDLAEPVLVTVTSAEAEPLDWGEARLADAMDLRRRYPLHVAANNNSQS